MLTWIWRRGVLREEEEKDGLRFEEGVQGKVMMEGFVRKWFTDRCFGFVEVNGYSVFCNADTVVGQDCPRVGSKAWVKVVEDRDREERSWKAAEAWDQACWEEEEARRKAEEAVQVAAKAAKLACKTAERRRWQRRGWRCQSPRMCCRCESLHLRRPCQCLPPPPAPLPPPPFCRLAS